MTQSYKRSFYSKEESCSLDASEDESLNDEILFMALKEAHANNQ